MSVQRHYVPMSTPHRADGAGAPAAIDWGEGSGCLPREGERGRSPFWVPRPREYVRFSTLDPVRRAVTLERPGLPFEPRRDGLAVLPSVESFLDPTLPDRVS